MKYLYVLTSLFNLYCTIALSAIKGTAQHYIWFIHTALFAILGNAQHFIRFIRRFTWGASSKRYFQIIFLPPALLTLATLNICLSSFSCSPFTRHRSHTPDTSHGIPVSHTSRNQLRSARPPCEAGPAIVTSQQASQVLPSWSACCGEGREEGGRL